MDIPLWWKMLTELPIKKHFSHDSHTGKLRLNKKEIIRELSPGLYDMAGAEVKAENEYFLLKGGRPQKTKFGRKLGSIPITEFIMHPELRYDKTAQDKYFQDHPEMKAE